MDKRNESGYASGHHPNSLANLNTAGGPGGPGRPKGKKNKFTYMHKRWCQRFVWDEAYRNNLRDRIMAGQAPQMEQLIWYVAMGGKPKEQVDVSNTDGSMRPIHIYLPQKDPLPPLDGPIDVTPTPDALPHHADVPTDIDITS
jgi:hypothetical protein